MEQPMDDSTSRWDGLKTRAITAAMLVVILLTVAWIGGFIFNLLILCVALAMWQEWRVLNVHQNIHWQKAGWLYVVAPCAALIWLRNLEFSSDLNGGAHIVLYLWFVVWATDIGAYFAGKRIGGPKLLPSISPHKTWAGLIGGMAAAALTGILCFSFTPYPLSMTGCAVLAMFLAVVAQAGDLFESWMKRRADVKDSGTLFPGHGGLLDRIDGLVFATPVFALLVYFSGLPTE